MSGRQPNVRIEKCQIQERRKQHRKNNRKSPLGPIVVVVVFFFFVSPFYYIIIIIIYRPFGSKTMATLSTRPTKYLGFIQSCCWFAICRYDAKSGVNGMGACTISLAKNKQINE